MTQQARELCASRVLPRCVRVPRHLECARGIVGGRHAHSIGCRKRACGRVGRAGGGRRLAGGSGLSGRADRRPVQLERLLHRREHRLVGRPVQCFVGLQISPHFRSMAAAIATASTNRLTSNSVTGGAQTGYNWQAANILAGIESDVSFMGNNATFATAPLAGVAGTSLSESAQISWLVTVRPARRLRLGQLAGLRHRRLGDRQGHVHGRSRSGRGRPDRNDDRPRTRTVGLSAAVSNTGSLAGGAQSSNTCTSISAR